MKHLITLLACSLWAILLQGQAITISFQVTPDACGNGTGRIVAIIEGGTIPYTVVWSNGASNPGDTLYISNITGLSAGSYSVTVTDFLGVEATGTVAVPATTGLPPFNDTVVSTCDGACTDLFYTSLNGLGAGPPFTATSDPPLSIGPTIQGNMLGLLGACGGFTYLITLSDALGCSTEWTVTVEDVSTPNLLSQQIIGSCANGTQGSIELQYDQPIDFLAYTPNWNPVSFTPGGPGQVFLTGLGPGSYITQATSLQSIWCYDSLQFVVPTLTSNCGTLQGTVYADLQGDCNLDVDDLPLPWRMVSIGPSGDLAMTNAQGFYIHGLEYGNYTADHASPGFTVNCPPTLPATFTVDAVTPLATIDFALEPDLGPDASVFLNTSCHTPGDSVYYWATVTNSGPFTLSDLTLTVDFDPLLSFQFADSTPVVNVPGSVTWALQPLGPFATASRWMRLLLPPDPALLGMNVVASATVSGPTADADPTNDTYLINNIVIGPYDPNDKLVQTSSGARPGFYVLTLDAYVDYTIRFQNTGSAPAVNVFLLDTIAPNLDLTSFSVLGASHAFEASLLEDRVLRFDFPNIMLPDSSADFAESIGFISFRLRPNELLPGDLLTNAADIFFDLNPPIRTNTATVLVDLFESVDEGTKPRLQLFPNPVQDALRIAGLPSGVHKLDILSLDGRLLISYALNGEQATLDLSRMAAGIYLVQLRDDEGRMHSARFVKE
ncbi:MAG: T9SS type A sorting domain-containing protein [Flavobacteriales bacterium]